MQSCYERRKLHDAEVADWILDSGAEKRKLHSHSLCLQVLSSVCGIVMTGERLHDLKVADWMLDPGATEKTLHSMVTNHLPLEVHLLEGR